MALTLSGDGDITGLAVGALPPNVIGTGAVLQVVQATKTDSFTTTSTSFTTPTGLSLSITPSSSSNKILISLNNYFLLTLFWGLFFIFNSILVFLR